jgi:hypothetical protein
MIWMQVLTWPLLEVVEVERLTVEPPVIVTVADTEPLDTVLVMVPAVVLSHSAIFGHNPKSGCWAFNDVQTFKHSKKQLGDSTPAARTARPPPPVLAPSRLR